MKPPPTTPTYKPDDFSDVGQAAVLAKHYGSALRYSTATGFLCYSGGVWTESELSAQAIAQELTERQLEEAELELESARQSLASSGVIDIMLNTPKTRAEALMSDEQKLAYHAYLAAKTYRAYALERRNTKRIAAALQEVRPMVEIAPQALDAHPFLLCTPDAVYDLRKGLAGARAHAPQDYMTKSTAISPGDKGAHLWQAFLHRVFCGDEALIDYVRCICGLVAIGKVYVEALVISYGSGRNGKSTFWNTIARVLGSYSGNISAETLTYGCRRNVKPEIAEIKGKRLLIAAELQEGALLSDAMVKQLCSTDAIFAEKKYRDPFSFTPSHTLVLYTNHLPKVSASDDGTWRRLIIIPFSAKIEGNGDIKNYSDYLFHNAGESILAWIIEGARDIIERKFALTAPECVRKAVEEYRAQNNWFAQFVNDACELDPAYRESSNALYQAYRAYCREANLHVRRTAEFYAALEGAGFKRVSVERKQYFTGLRLHPENNKPPP